MTTVDYSYRPPIRYGEIWGTSFRLAWQNPSLWFWGFLVAGGPIQLYQLVVYGAGYGAASNLMEQGMSSYFVYTMLTVVGYLALASFFSPVLIWSAIELETRSTYNIGVAIAEGAANWGRFIAYEVLSILLITLITFPFSMIAAILFAVSKSAGIVSLVVALPLAFLLAIVASFVFIYARRITVIERRGFFESIRAGYKFLRENKSSSAVLALTFTAIWLAWGLAFFFVTMVTSGPEVFLGTPEVLQQTKSGPGDWAFAIFNLIMAPVLWTLSSNVLTIFYLRLQPRSIPPAESPPPPPVTS